MNPQYIDRRKLANLVLTSILLQNVAGGAVMIVNQTTLFTKWL